MEFKNALQSISELTMNDIQVYFDPNRIPVDHNEILIGFGSEEQGIVLNNKHSNHSSVSELVCRLPQDKITHWKDIVFSNEQTQIKLFLEDLSPDSCLGYILLFCRLLDIEVMEIPIKWVEYVNKWESGDVTTTGSPFHSWGCLLSSLAHDHINVHNTEENQLIFKSGFVSCIHFTISLLLEDVSPESIPTMQHVPEYYRAKSLLNNEYQSYLYETLSAEKIQLLLPLNYSDREVLVDSYIATETKPMGSLKAFIRNDSEHSWLKNGFGLMAINRPDAIGSGNDIVISVDPSSGIHLKELWNELERKENENWNGTRPDDQPRFPDRSNANQPWYDEMGKYTILAAPKKIGEQYGSKLTWDDVLSTIWNLFNPVNSLKVQPYLLNGISNDHISVYQCSPIIEDHGKTFRAMKWVSFGDQQSLIISPTVKRIFAAIACSQSNRLPEIKDLPSDSSFDFIQLPGGFSVIHGSGVLFFDDWSNEESRISLYQEEFSKLLSRFKEIAKLQFEIKLEVDEIVNSIDNQRYIRKNYIQLNNKLSKIKMKLRHVTLNTMSSSYDYHLQLFREQVEKRWGISTQLEELSETVSEFEDIIESFVETRTNQLISTITIYGFPVALFSTLFAFVVQDFFDRSFFTPYGAPSFLILTTSLIILLKHLLNK